MQHLETHAALSGRVDWELTQGGVTVQAGRQSNLITNAGLDALAVHSFLPAELDGEFALGTWKKYGAVGEGSAAPAVTDTALSTPLGAGGGTMATGGVSETFTLLSPGVYEWATSLQFAESEGIGNLTEFGYSSASDAPLYVRELFRDGGGVPIVVTKTNAQKLRITHKLRITLGPVAEIPQSTPMSGDVGGDLGGAVMLARGSGYSLDAATLGYWMAGNFKVFPATHNQSGPMVYDSPGSVGGSMARASNLTFGPYVAGSYARTLEATWDTDRANATFSGVGLGVRVQGYDRLGFRHRFAAPFTKDDLHRLTLSGWRLTWGRA